MTKRVERREFVRSLGTIPLAALPAAVFERQQEKTVSPKMEFVAAGKDRAGAPVAMGFSSLGFKVSGQQTDGRVFFMEHVGLTRGGGPPRHIHYEQEEWFYVLEGEVVAEVGEERIRLRMGDAVFAPRQLPHRYIYVAEKPGRLLIAFTPAGQMEAYFRNRRGLDPESFAKYGMKYVGPALTLEEASKV